MVSTRNCNLCSHTWLPDQDKKDLDMTPEEILKHKRFTYKDHDYIVIGLVRLKSYIEGRWESGIEYVNPKDETLRFVRSYKDFISKFKATKWLKEYECEYVGPTSATYACRFKACQKSFTHVVKEGLIYCTHCGNKQ